MGKSLKVVIPLFGSENWTAGATYFNNLKIAVDAFAPDIEICFVEVPAQKPHGYLGNAIAELRVKYAGLDVKFTRLMKSNNPDCIFSAGYKRAQGIPFISWLPDFQHLHSPGMFSRLELYSRDYVLKIAAKKATIVVLSSNYSKNDYTNFVPYYSRKARLMNYTVSMPDNVFSSSPDEVLSKYNLPEKFFYLPNQFWKHKNHLTAFRAVLELKKSGIDICLVCSGNTSDYRNPGHYKSLISFIEQNNLQSNIRMLGMIDHADVYKLIRQSLAVLNPSLFEGWSTTVEETKSIGKRMILSDIEVHREQDAPKAEYFAHEDTEALAELLSKYNEECKPGPDYEMESIAINDLPIRQNKFALKFSELVKEAIEIYNR